MSKPKVKITNEIISKNPNNKAGLYKSTYDFELLTMQNTYQNLISSARNKALALNKLLREIDSKYINIQNEMNPLQHLIDEEYQLNNNLELEEIISKHCDTELKNSQYAKYKVYFTFISFLMKERDKLNENYVNRNESYETPEIEPLNNEITIARQSLAIYYLLIELGLDEPFLNKADLAKFIHLLSGKKIPAKLDNSEIASCVAPFNIL